MSKVRIATSAHSAPNIELRAELSRQRLGMQSMTLSCVLRGPHLPHFMWQPDMLQVAKFLDAGVKRMQEIDPDAGSNL